MRAGMHTVKAECAIHVARLLRLEKLQLAAALVLVAAETVVRRASTTNVETADPDLNRRDQRLNELILPDRTHVLAETRPFKKTINNERGREIAHDHPCCPAWAVPQAERFVAPKKDEYEHDGDPFRAQTPGPRPSSG